MTRLRSARITWARSRAVECPQRTGFTHAAGARHEELWNLLVPSHGACATVQGEVIRKSGRVADEWFRNGGVNWDRDYAAMARAFYAQLSSHRPLPPNDLAACKEVVNALSDDPDSSERLMEWAVEWVQRNPEPIRLAPPSYKR